MTLATVDNIQILATRYLVHYDDPKTKAAIKHLAGNFTRLDGEYAALREGPLLSNLFQYAVTGARWSLGGFAELALANKFSEAVCAADEVNALNLRAIALFIYNRMPSASWGSEDLVAAWAASGGIVGNK